MKFIIAIQLLVSLNAFAGGTAGNGGVSVVCRDENNKRIVSAQLLDIYEGQVRYGKKYETELDVDMKVELSQLKLAGHPEFLAAFQDELAKVKAIMKFIPVGNELEPTNDAFPVISKKGCKFEQVANYTDDGDLLVSQEIHNEFNNLDQAGLLVHETVYALFRKSGATDSRQARKLTAEMLAQNADQKVIDQILKTLFPIFGVEDGDSFEKVGSAIKRIRIIKTLNIKPNTNHTWISEMCTISHISADYNRSITAPKVLEVSEARVTIYGRSTTRLNTLVLEGLKSLLMLDCRSVDRAFTMGELKKELSGVIEIEMKDTVEVE